MARVIYDTSPDRPVIATAINDLKAQIGAGAFFHLDKYENTVTLADAVDQATAIALVNQIKAVYNGTGQVGAAPGHRLDDLAHKAVDSTDAVASPAATDLASAITLANEIKGDYNTHIASATYHYNADATNAVAAANATDLASLLTLVNQIKAKLNAHMASGPAAASLRVLAG